MRIQPVLAAAAASACAVAASAQSAPGWSEAPTFAQAAAAYPAKARAAGTGAMADLSCTVNRQGWLRDCVAVEERPSAMGVGAAARKLAEQLRTSPSENTKEVRVKLAFTPDMAKGAAAFAGNPTWAALPAPADFQAAFPKSVGGPNTARVVMDCVVADGGALSACKVESEDPAGQGLGAGALALAPKFRVGLLTVEGVPTVGAHVHVPIRYELQQVPAAK
jgi:TonB family protein